MTGHAQAVPHSTGLATARLFTSPSLETASMMKRTDQVSNRLSGLLYSIFALPAVQMCARMRITEVGGPVGQHAVQHTRIQRCCGLHVQIRRYSLELYALRFDRLGAWKRTNGCHPSGACRHVARSPCFNKAAVYFEAAVHFEVCVFVSVEGTRVHCGALRQKMSWFAVRL